MSGCQGCGRTDTNQYKRWCVDELACGERQHAVTLAALVEANDTIRVLRMSTSPPDRKAEAELTRLRAHYDAAGPDHNLLALLDLYHERAVTAEGAAHLWACGHRPGFAASDEDSECPLCETFIRVEADRDDARGEAHELKARNKQLVEALEAAKTAILASGIFDVHGIDRGKASAAIRRAEALIDAALIANHKEAP